MIRYAVSALAALCILAATTHAGFILTFDQVANTVVATGSGTINTAGLSLAFDTGANENPELEPASATVIVGSTAMGYVYTGSITGPSKFGNGAPTPGTPGSGNLVGFFSPDDILVPVGYVSGSPLSDSTTWNLASISSLGLFDGTYTYTWGSGPTAGSFEVVVVPEPSSLILLGLAITVVGLGAW